MAGFTSIPVMDLSLCKSPSTKPQLLHDLRNALVRTGFFYVKNHSISEEVQQRAIDESTAFFKLPLDKKLEIETVNSKHFLGYNSMDTEWTAAKVDHNESIAIGADLIAPPPDEPVYMNLQGPSQWPDESILPNFRNAITTYRASVQTLADSITPLIAEALDIPTSALNRLFTNKPFSRLKITNYPPPPASSISTTVPIQGVGPHKDGVFMTYLLQGGSHNSLEVQNKSGTWVAVPPIPGTLVANIGRLLEIISGGVCTATTHRVIITREGYIGPSGEQLSSRLSLPFFQHVNLRLMPEDMYLNIPTHVKELADGDNVVSDAESFFAGLFDRAVGDSVFVSVLMSFQNVARSWYPDLLPLALKKHEESKKR